MFRADNYKIKPKEQPETEQLLQMHLASILEDEVREALSDEWMLAEFSYKPPIYYSQQPNIRSRPYAIINCTMRPRDNWRGLVVRTYPFPNPFNINELVDVFNDTLSDIPKASFINHKQVLEKYFCDVILISPIKPIDKTVYISGADPLLGRWKTAKKLSYNATKDQWRFFLPYGVKKREVRFLQGEAHLGKEVPVNRLTWEQHGNRLLPIEETEEKENKPKQPTSGEHTQFGLSK